MKPIAPLSLADRSLVRGILQRTQAEPIPMVALSRLQEIALRYEVQLATVERELEELSLRNGAKAVALEELRERVASGTW